MGAGKSTTVKILVGLLEPGEGRIFFEGKSILDDLPTFQRRISQLPATFAFLVSIFAAAWLRMRYLRRQGWGEASLIYEESPDAMADLGPKA
jgi:ABC-type multidrug transport system ATPase subunit